MGVMGIGPISRIAMIIRMTKQRKRMVCFWVRGNKFGSILNVFAYKVKSLAYDE
jgi:hypothetical protein